MNGETPSRLKRSLKKKNKKKKGNANMKKETKYSPIKKAKNLLFLNHRLINPLRKGKLLIRKKNWIRRYLMDLRIAKLEMVNRKRLMIPLRTLVNYSDSLKKRQKRQLKR